MSRFAAERYKIAIYCKVKFKSWLIKEFYEYHGLSGNMANFLILFIPNKFLPLLSDQVRVLEIERGIFKPVLFPSIGGMGIGQQYTVNPVTEL